MKKGFKEQKIFNKIVITILVIMLFNLIIPTFSQADIGGVLLSPICDLLAALGDGVNWLLMAISGEEEENGSVFKTGLEAYAYLTSQKSSDSASGDVTDAIESGAEAAIEAVNGNEKWEKDENLNTTIDTSLPVKTIIASSYKEEDEDGNKVDVTNVGVADIRISPIEIFAGKVALLDANFFREEDEETYNKQNIGTTEVSPAIQLRKVVSSWYQGLRLIAIVGLLSVLAYIGIRIMISSAASDKAKYKQMLTDWVIALCLIFFLHYVMVFTMTMVDLITEIFIPNNLSPTINEITVVAVGADGNAYEITNKGVAKETAIETGKYTGVLDMLGIYGAQLALVPGGQVIGGALVLINGITHYISNYTDAVMVTYSTNIIGYVRMKVNSPLAMQKLTYTIMYLAMTCYTIYFMFIYIKRLITLILLTMIAPLVALTYPIDKMKDGKAQAFNYWLKEYVINAILPIIHLIIYKVLISAAIDLVAKLPIYALAVMAFIVPAEKIVRNMFGIRSDTAPSLGGFAGGALAAHTVSTLANKVGQKVKGAGKGKERIRTKDNAPGVKGSKEPSSMSEIAGGEKQKLLGSKQYNEQRKQGNYDYNQQKKMIKGQAQLTPEQRKAQLEALKRQNKARKRALKLNKDNTGRIGHNAWEKVRKRYSLPEGKAGVAKLAAIAGKSAAKTVGKGAIRASGAIMGGSIGLAGGIVSGDLNDTWKGLAGGAAAGGIIGNSLANKVEEIPSGIMNFSEDIYYGDEEAERRREEKDFSEDYDNIRYMEKYHPELSAREIKEELKTMSRYQESGVTDINQLDAMRQLEANKFATERTSQEEIRKDIINTGRLAKKLGESGFQDEKKRKAAEEALTNAYVVKQKMSKANAEALAKKKMKEAGEIVGYYSNKS